MTTTSVSLDITATYIPVASEVLQKFDLTKRTLRKNLLGEDVGDLLHRDAFVGCCILCGAVRIVSLCVRV